MLPLQLTLLPNVLRHHDRPALCGASALAMLVSIGCGATPALALGADTGDSTDRAAIAMVVQDGAGGQNQTEQPAKPARRIAFEANNVDYDSNTDTVTATGDVVMRSEDQSVLAQKVEWDRKTGMIVATGNIRFVDENGNQLYTERLELTDKFEAGAMENLLLALREGGRLAANSGSRLADGTVTLSQAAYTACSVEGVNGCSKDPSWRITAERVTYDPDNNTVRLRGAYLELFGARLLPLPGLSFRTDGKAVSGILVPDFRISKSNGAEINGNYYWRLADNRDLTVGAHLFTQAPPMAYGQWRHLVDKGAYQITGYLTESRRISSTVGVPDSQRGLRGYVFANGRFQFDPEWSLTASIRRASDRTFLRRYDLSYDDTLRSYANLERIDELSYFSFSGWATQTLRRDDVQGQVPVALPVIDYRRRLADPVAGGTAEFQINSINLMRGAGQDTQRAFASARWDLRGITPLGQEVSFTALARGDVYHSSHSDLTSTAIYRGNSGWQARGVGLAAMDVKWPFIGKAFGGTQVLTPRIQLVATPPIRNLAVPNEDSRAIDLEDSNLFALNRFPGYDRVEDGVRITYGFDWELQRPDWRIKSTLGQSYRFNTESDVLVDGTGLSERLSDFVGRTEVRFKDFVKFTYRYRFDKDNFKLRRNEVDATIGSRRTYAELGYLKLNRDVNALVEDLQDREELRAAVRVAFARYWSAFGSGVFNLTDRSEDPTQTADGFQAVRTRLGIAYQDDCLEMGVTWRRDYLTSGDAVRGNTFQVYFSLRNLGFR